MRLVDSHCHLQADRFAGDVDLVIGGARLAGVERILVPGWDRASAEAAIVLVERHSWLHAAVGVHPHAAAAVDDATWTAIVGLASDGRVRAIGETGLDTDRGFSPLETQRSNLRRNLALALAVGKPVILHCRSAPGERDAQDTLLDELRLAGFGGDRARQVFGASPPGVLHSFSGPVPYAQAVLELGFAISFSGLVFRRGEESSAAVARLAPANRLLVETDSPYLAPPGAPRRRNEPEWVAVTARWLADQRAVDPIELGEQLIANYDDAFGARSASDDPARPSSMWDRAQSDLAR